MSKEVEVVAATDGSGETELVRKSNVLIEAKIDFTANEAKFVEKLIASHKNHHPADRDYQFDCRELLIQFGIGPENHSRLKKMTDSIQSKVMSIKSDGKDRRINILYHCTYHDGEGRISTRFHPHLLPYVKNLKSFYSEYHLANITKLDSTYSIKIYQLLKQYQKIIGTRTFDIAEFRELISLSLTKYKAYGDLKKRILIPAQKEIEEKTDISFTFAEKKIGRKVIELEFKISANKNQRGVDIDTGDITGIDADTLDGEFSVVDIENIERLLHLDFGVHKRTAKSLCTKFGSDQVMRNAKWVKSMLNGGTEISNLGGYMKSAIEKDYANGVDEVGKEGARTKPKEKKKASAEELEADLIQNIIREMGKANSLAMDKYIDEETNESALDLFLSEYLESGEGASVMKLTLKQSAKKVLRDSGTVKAKLDEIKKSAPVFADFKRFLKPRILSPIDTDLVFFAKTQGVALKKLVDGSDTKYVVE